MSSSARSDTLVIRAAQLDRLGTSRLARFEAMMIEHHQRFFPEWSKALGDAGLTAFVRHGLQRAKVHGFKIERDVARYLHAMQALGMDFDQSPEYPWAAQLLKQTLPAALKMNRLRDAVEYHIEARRIHSARHR